MRAAFRTALAVLGAALAAVAVATAGAALYVAANDGFGSGDVLAYAIWSIPFSLWLAAVAVLTRDIAHTWSRAGRYLAATLLGALAGLVWTTAIGMVAGPLLMMFSFPVLYLWMLGGAAALLLWTAVRERSGPADEVRTRPHMRRLALLGIGLPLAALVTAAVSTWGVALASIFIWNRAEPELHLLPAGYEGSVIIVFDDPAGSPPLYEDGRRVYMIPEDGMLRTQFPPNSGWGKPEYAFDDAAGRRTPIAAGHDCRTPSPGDPVRVCAMAYTGMSGVEVRPYNSYIVTRAANPDTVYRAAYARVGAWMQDTTPQEEPWKAAPGPR